MKTVNFLYGKTTLDLEVPDDTPVLTSNIDELRSEKSGYDIVAEAMENPIDSPLPLRTRQRQTGLYDHYQRSYTPGAKPGHSSAHDP